MFNFFKNRKREPINFNTLVASPLKDKYFFRKAQWGKLDSDMIFVIDPHNPRMITLDPWPQLIFLGADGLKTVEQFVQKTAEAYTTNEKVPANWILPFLTS